MFGFSSLTRAKALHGICDCQFVGCTLSVALWSLGASMHENDEKENRTTNVFPLSDLDCEEYGQRETCVQCTTSRSTESTESLGLCERQKLGPLWHPK